MGTHRPCPASAERLLPGPGASGAWAPGTPLSAGPQHPWQAESPAGFTERRPGPAPSSSRTCAGQAQGTTAAAPPPPAPPRRRPGPRAPSGAERGRRPGQRLPRWWRRWRAGWGRASGRAYLGDRAAAAGAGGRAASRPPSGQRAGQGGGGRAALKVTALRGGGDGGSGGPGRAAGPAGRRRYGNAARRAGAAAGPGPPWEAAGWPVPARCRPCASVPRRGTVCSVCFRDLSCSFIPPCASVPSRVPCVPQGAAMSPCAQP